MPGYRTGATERRTQSGWRRRRGSGQAQPPTKLLNVKEVADRLGVGRNKVYELLYKGEIRSVAIGRTRRISPVALAEFIARPTENALDIDPLPRQLLRRSASPPKTPVPPRPPTPTERRRTKSVETIDLSPKPVPPTSHLGMSEGEFEQVLASMLEKGWPADVIEQIRADHKEGVHRVNVLTVNDATRYLGLSRYGIEKLIKAGKLRLFTITPTYRDEEPANIPAKDVAGLR